MVFITSLTLVPLAAHAQLSFYPMSTEAAFYLRWKHLQRDPVSPGSDCLNEQNDGWDLGTHGVTSSHHLLIPPNFWSISIPPYRHAFELNLCLGCLKKSRDGFQSTMEEICLSGGVATWCCALLLLPGRGLWGETPVWKSPEEQKELNRKGVWGKDMLGSCRKLRKLEADKGKVKERRRKREGNGCESLQECCPCQNNSTSTLCSKVSGF